MIKNRIQWYDTTLDRFHKYDSTTNELLATKMSEGAYERIPVVKQQPKTEKYIQANGNKRKRVNYLSNKELLIEFAKSKEIGQMNNKLAHMLMLLTQRISKKGNYCNYSYLDEMRGYALLMLVNTWHKFDPAKSQNPFAYYTTCINHSFVQYLSIEKRQRNVKNKIMVNSGLNPSFSYQDENSGNSYATSHYEDDSTYDD